MLHEPLDLHKLKSTVLELVGLAWAEHTADTAMSPADRENQILTAVKEAEVWWHQNDNQRRRGKEADIPEEAADEVTDLLKEAPPAWVNTVLKKRGGKSFGCRV